MNIRIIITAVAILSSPFSVALDLEEAEFQGSCVSKFSNGKDKGCKNKPLTGFSCQNIFTPDASTICKLVGGTYYPKKRCKEMSFKMCLGKTTLPYWFLKTKDSQLFPTTK